MPTEDHASSSRLWIGLVAFTLVNLGVWVSTNVIDGSDPDLVRIDRSTLVDDFERTGRFGMIFDRDVFEDGQIGHPFERSPFQIDPPISGTWAVEGSDAVAFQPDAPPPAGRIYRVALARSHPLFDRFKFDEKTLPDLRYRPLVLEDIELGEVSSTERGISTSARFEFRFDQAVSMPDLAAATTIFVNGRETVATWRADDAPETFHCTIPVAPGARISFDIAEGLTAREGLIGIDDLVRREFSIAGALTAIGADSYEDRMILIRFDRTLEKSQRIPGVKVTPDPGNVTIRIADKTLLVQGRFDRRRTYTVGVDPPLLAEDRSVLVDPIEHRVTIAPPRPTLRVATTNGQMMPTGALQIPIRHFGNSAMNLEIHRMVDEHLPMVLAEVVGRRRLASVGEAVFEGVVPLETDPDRVKTSLLDLGAYTDRRPGLYRIAVRSETDYWNRHQSLLLVSDLAIEIQRTEDEILAWVTSISSGSPVEGATVTAWAPNITSIGSNRTDTDGLTRIPLEGDPCRVVTATIGDQVVFVRTAETRRIDDRQLAGDEWPQPLEVSMHADRGVHRPGETVHVSGILRTDAGEVPMGTPLSIRWMRPDQRLSRSLEVVTEDEQGTFSLDIDTDTLDPTGHWSLECRLPGDSRTIGRIACPIMPFLPVRLEVDAELDASSTGVDFTISANYLHGAPAVNLAATARTRFSPIRYTSEEHPDFVFEDPPTSKPVTRESKGVVDETGLSIFSIAPPESPGAWKVVATGSVSEPGGRSTSSTRQGLLDTATRHRGLRLPGGTVHEPESPIDIDVVDIVDGNETSETTVSISISRIDREWYRVNVYESWEWRTRENLTPCPIEGIQVVDTGSEGTRRHRIPGLTDGEYRITATSADAEEMPTTSVDLHVSRWRSSGRLAAERPDRIEIIPDETRVRPGDTFSVLLRAPFAGTALISVETDRIHQTRVVEISGDGVLVELTVPARTRSTCFVNATLVRPVDPERERWQAVIARGSARIPIDLSPHRIDPDLLASDGARPGEIVRVSLSVPGAGPGAMARVWAVEEGALLATGFKAPDPAEDFLRDRRQVVSAASTLSDLLEDVSRPGHLDRIGGDAARSRREPVPVRLPETKVIWNTFAVMDEGGILEIDFEMPEIDGAMRVMAVVVDEDRYGATERRISVTPPIGLTAALPRTAAPGDLMRVPLTIRNNTAVDRTVDLRVEAGEGLLIEGHAEAFELEAGGSKVIGLDIRACGIGAQPIVIHARDQERSTGVEGRMEWSVAVRPPTARRSETTRLLVEAGDTVILDGDPGIELFDGMISVGISGSSHIDLAPVIEDLIRYPYGCTEQVGSTLQGLLAALQSPILAGDRRSEGIRRLAADGFVTLWQRQLRDGRLPYWSNGEGDDWLTIRTALITVKARDLEIPLPARFDADLVDAVDRMVRKGGLPIQQAAMACRVLASAQQSDPALMERLRIDLEALRLDERAHLAEAFGLVGDLESARTIIDTFIPPPPASPLQSGSFTSDGTQVAIALAAALGNHPESRSIPALHASLLDLRREDGWRTTYEDAAAVDALGAFAMKYPPAGNAAGSVEIAGETITHEGPGSTTRTWPLNTSTDHRSTITASGDDPLHVVITTSGHPHADVEPREDFGIRLERSWLSMDGTSIDAGSPIEAGEVVVVEIEWMSLLDRDIPNIAIVEVLPGGMEFELPALITSDASRNVMNAVDQAEFRDDRLLVFDTATPKPQKLRFAMRAVVPGTWVVPGTRAEAMYEDTLHSRSPSTMLEIDLP